MLVFPEPTGWCIFAGQLRIALRPNHDSSAEKHRPTNEQGSRIVTDQEKQKAEEIISRLETAVGQIFPRDGGNASLITGIIQSLNGLRSLLGLVRPH
jgi:hypothetical protein